MKTTDVDLLIVPGWEGSGPDHWQSRWERNLPTARRVMQADWDRPRRVDWVAALKAAIEQAERPVVLVAHSLRVTTVAHAAAAINAERVAGAFLVGAPDIEGRDIWPVTNGGFAPVPLEPLPFPAVLVASSSDPYCTPEQSQAFAAAWGAQFVDAGDAGHINTVSGHGPWPEGLMRLGGFLVSPAEVEQVLLQLDGVDAAQVVAVDRPGGARPVAFVVAPGGVDESAAIIHCHERLARYKVPVRVIAIDEFPTTPSANGTKIQKVKLRAIAATALRDAP